jgi:hypothetical protein
METITKTIDKIQRTGQKSCAKEIASLALAMTNESRTKADLFEGYFSERGFIAEALDTVEDFDTGQLAIGIIIDGDFVTEFFSCYGRILETYIKGIDFGIIGNMHVGSLLKVIDINSNNNDLGLFFNEDRIDLFGFVLLTVPDTGECNVLAALKLAAFSRLPLGGLNTIDNLFDVSPALQKASFSMLTESNRFIRKRAIHNSNYTSMVGESQREKLGRRKRNTEYRRQNLELRKERAVAGRHICDTGMNSNSNKEQIAFHAAAGPVFR